VLREKGAAMAQRVLLAVLLVAAFAAVILDGGASAGVNAVTSVSASSDRDSTGTKKVTVACPFAPNGNDYIVGGASVVNGDKKVVISSSVPSASSVRWRASAVEARRYSKPWSLRVKALCIDN
jgi:hypothetical protein